nr:hypothetical protein [Candidatus Nanopelagicales bacterium]
AADAGTAAALVARALESDTLRDERGYWVQRHFGDVSPGASTQRFIDATRDVSTYGAAAVAEVEQRQASAD